MIKVVNVIPIARGIGRELLSYYTSRELRNGSLVDVPLRKKMVPAIVVSSEEATDMKAGIKSASWNLKKIKSESKGEFLTESYMDTVKDIADYYSATSGSVLSSMIPKFVFETSPPKGKILESKSKQGNKLSLESFVLQGTDEERLANHRSLIREEFAKGMSVFFCLPTIEDIRQISEILPKGIESYTFVLHGGLSSKEQTLRWNNALSESHPVLIIATGSFLCLPRADIGTIVVERESSPAFKIQLRPFIDIRTFAERLAKKSGNRLIFADNLLRTETIWRYKNGDLVEFAPLKFRTLTTADSQIIDMRKKSDDDDNEPFKMVGNELKDLITETRNRSENLFIFSARRGLSPSVSCGDCGNIVSCTTCNAPVALHSSIDGKKNGNFFLCHKCGEKRDADLSCVRCESWKLVTLGIGSAGVEKAVLESVKDAVIFRLDIDTAKTSKKAHDIVRNFLQTPCSVLIGTEMSLPYIQHIRIASSAVASIDALFSLPDFRINERVFRLLSSVKRIADRNFLVQTRLEDSGVLKHALQGNTLDFFREEIAERKSFGYPPFSTIIKIALKGEKLKVKKDTQKLVTHLKDFEITAFPAFAENAKGDYTMHAIIKLSKDSWPDTKLLEKLRQLPPQFSINVDPDTLL